MWTEFWDAHSGGEQKESFKFCYIEADKWLLSKEVFVIYKEDVNNG